MKRNYYIYFILFVVFSQYAYGQSDNKMNIAAQLTTGSNICLNYGYSTYRADLSLFLSLPKTSDNIYIGATVGFDSYNESMAYPISAIIAADLFANGNGPRALLFSVGAGKYYYNNKVFANSNFYKAGLSYNMGGAQLNWLIGLEFMLNNYAENTEYETINLQHKILGLKFGANFSFENR